MKSLCNYFLCLLLLLSFSVVANTYSVEALAVKPIHNVIQRTGKLAFKRTLNLSFKNSGYLSHLSIDEGDYFKKGQLLASMDTAELNENKNAAYAKLLQAKRDVNRIKHLLAQGLGSKQELEIAQTIVETTRASFKIAFYNLEKAQVIAPFSGVVLSRFAELGEFMTPGRELIKVAALKNNWVVKVALTGVEVGQIRLKQTVQVRLHTLGLVDGIISKIPAQPNTEGSLFMIDVLLPHLLLTSGVVAGQIAEVIIDIASDNFAYQLPVAALMALDEQGKALVAITNEQDEYSQQIPQQQNASHEEFSLKVKQQAFDIVQFDNRFVYLQADNLAEPIYVVTQGWQHILFSANK